jgi:hypothetical protein
MCRPYRRPNRCAIPASAGECRYELGAVQPPPQTIT